MPELVECYKVSKIGIFGSVARNEATDESDIDIVVYMEPDMFKRFHRRFMGIHSPINFICDDAGLDRLDAIAMMASINILVRRQHQEAT